MCMTVCMSVLMSWMCMFVCACICCHLFFLHECILEEAEVRSLIFFLHVYD